ncbi:MAG: helix-turn-helix domain-containing protein [Phycisphaerales bacterium]|nr:helix-turn-helix domain-containing protein [Phycisphaerales bacterium]
MLDSVLTQLVAAAVSEAQRPLVAELAAARAELGEARRELGELRRALEQPASGGELVYLTVAQVAERLGVCQKTVKRWLEDGRLAHVRLPGGGIRVAVAELERVLRENARKEAAE